MAWRDVKVRYTQAVLGGAWAVLQPVLMVAVFSLILGELARVPSPNMPYAVLAFAGLVPWTFFANSVATSTQSLITDSNLVTKVYFNRFVIPLGSIVSWLPDLGIASVLLLAFMLPFGVTPSLAILLAPLFIVAAAAAATGAAAWLSALNVAYRDVRYAVPFLLQIGLFATPVVYPASLVPGRYQWVLGLNPMAGVVEGFRWSVVGRGPAPVKIMAISAAVGIAVLLAGLRYFRKVEHFFADII